jgi:hypothetical protein
MNMKLNAFKQLKPGYVIASPLWRNMETTVVSIQTFADREANYTTSTLNIETADGQQIGLIDTAEIRAMRLRTALPLYDEERQILNIDTEEITWQISDDFGGQFIEGTLYNWSGSEPIDPDYQTEEQARQIVLEGLVMQAQQWAENNNWPVRHVTII